MIFKRLFRKYRNEIEIAGIASIIVLLFFSYKYSRIHFASEKGTALSTSSVRKKKIYPSPTSTPSSTPTPPLQVAPTIIQINIYVTNTSPIYNQIYTTSITNVLTPTTIPPTSIPNDTIIPTAASTPTPTVVPLVSSLTGKYFNNSTLTGSPVLTRTDNTINFDWGTGSPDVNINSDSFSVIWTGYINSINSNYQISLNHDDAMRIYIDDILIHNHWISRPAGWETFAVNLTLGNHPIRIEYADNTGSSKVYFDIQKL